MKSRGSTTFPLDFDIFAPLRYTIPCVNSRANGSRKPTSPMSFSALTKKRA
jgi:hypothetical protein